MTCQQFRWSVHGGIAPLQSTFEQRAALAAHLHTCPHCAEFMAKVPSIDAGVAMGVVSPENAAAAEEIIRQDRERLGGR